MDVGIPREIKPQETRVGMIPSSVAELTRNGHRVVVESGAGEKSGYQDEEYSAAGAEILDDAAAVFANAELIVKVKEPQTTETELLEPRHILFTYLHLAASKELTTRLLKSGCTAIAYETVHRNGHLPLLEPMSSIAGRMASMAGAYHLANHVGGSGVLLGGIPGVASGRVVVIGGGTSGENAARTAHGMGAAVTVLDINFERMRHLESSIPGIETIYSSEANLAAAVIQADLVIGAVLVPGAASPKLISHALLDQMHPGSVFVDIAIDQGGCSETSRPTTLAEPTFTEQGIVHYCVANMPAAFARTSTMALDNATHRWIQSLANHGLKQTCANHPDFLSGINCHKGKLTCLPVGRAHDLPTTDINELI